MPVPPAENDNQSLHDCLGRIQQAEKALFIALNEIVDTRYTILQIVEQGNAEHIKETADRPIGVMASLRKSIKDAGGLAVRESEVKMVVEDEAVVRTCASDRAISSDLDSNQRTQEEEMMQRLAHDAAEKLGLSKDDILNAHRLFCLHDTDESGKLSVNELELVLEEVTQRKMKPGETAAILGECDKNNDFELDFEEFLLCICHTPERKAQHLAAAVSHHDDPLDQKHKQFKLRMVGIPFSALNGFLAKELDEMSAFLSIPIIFLLFFCFVASSQLHQNNSILHSAEQAVRTDIENNANFGYAGVAPFQNGREGFKNIYDMYAVEDFWSFMDLGLMPLFFPSGWGTSEARANVDSYCTSGFDAMKGNGWDTSAFTGSPEVASPYSLDASLCELEDFPSIFPENLNLLKQFANETRRPYLLFNEIIAGVRMSQEQLPHVECQNTDLSGRTYVTPCMESNGWAWLYPDMDTALTMDPSLLNKPGGETVYFKSATPLEEVKAALRTLEDKRWLNQKTSKIQVLLTTYNNQLDMFIATYVNVLVSRGGAIHKVIKPVCIWLDPYRSTISYLPDILLVGLVLKLFVDEVWDLVLAIKSEGFKEGVAEYFNSFKNIIDWASIGYSVVVFVLWILWCSRVSAFGDLLRTADSHVVGSWPSTGSIFTPSNEQYWEDVDNLVDYYRTMLLVLAFYPFLIGARFFSTFSSQPRLGLVTATLGSAAKDIIHFLVVLAVTLVIFCSSAEFLFGIDVDEYENFGRTFISVFRAMLGDFDYVALTGVGRGPAAAWWLAFVVLVNMIMLNMLLVIIMDVYVNIKSSMNSEDEENFPTMWSQTYEILHRWSLQCKGQALSISKIVKCLNEHEETFYSHRESFMESHNVPQVEKLVTLSKFIDVVPGLKLEQAEQLMELTHDWWLLGKEAPKSTSDVIVQMRSVDLRVQRMQEMQTKFLDRENAAAASKALPDIDQAKRDHFLLKSREYYETTVPSASIATMPPARQPEKRQVNQEWICCDPQRGSSQI